MNARHHARLARALIAACGGLDEAQGACRLKRSRLSQCQDPNAGAWLTVDAVADLEAHCGDPIYSRAMFEAHQGGRSNEQLLDEVCEAAELAASLQSLVRRIGRRGLGAAGKRQAVADCQLLEGKVRDVLRHLDGESDLDGESS